MKPGRDIPEEYRQLVESAAQRVESGSQTIMLYEQPLDAARRLLHALRQGGIYGVLRPVRCREPHITQEAAQQLALSYLERLQAVDDRPYGPINAGKDWFLWWAFHTEKREAPFGYREFYVDKWDGEVTTDDWGIEDLHEFSRLG
jgi:hypothetical protein